MFVVLVVHVPLLSRSKTSIQHHSAFRHVSLYFIPYTHSFLFCIVPSHLLCLLLSLFFPHLLAQPMVGGMLNLGNVAGAITFVQDIFNQYSVLPRPKMHLKIIELALASELEYEAKRHVYFIQQIWKWQPTPYVSDAARSNIERQQANPTLSKKALQDMFDYFGFKLEEKDFF